MGAVSYDSATALIIVDVQNDFADPTGNLYGRERALAEVEAAGFVLV